MKQMNLSRSSKNFLCGASVSLILAVLMGGAYLVQSRRVSLAAMSDPEVRARDLPANKSAEFKAQKEKEALGKVVKLREVWRTKWALPHKDLLLTMLHSRPGDDSAWMNIAAQVPPSLYLANLGYELNPETDPGNADNVIASWGASWPLKTSPRHPEFAEHVSELNEGSKIGFQQRMAEWHDVKLSEAGSIALDKLCCLWVSGRVTWRTLKSIKVGIGSQSHWEFPPEQQVLPPYDFLTQGQPLQKNGAK